MRLLGTPDAMAAVEDARPEFDGVLPTPPHSAAAPSFVDPEHVTAWPLPSYPEDEGSAPAPLPYADSVDEEVLEKTQGYEAPPSALPTWEVPAPGPNWSPGPDYEHESEHQPEPEAEAEPEPSWQPDLEDAPPGPNQDEVVEAELLPEAAPEPAVAPAEPAPYAPPPLIEPSLHGPPLLPSQASSRPRPVQQSALSDDWPPPSGDPEAPPAGDTLETPVADTASPSARQFSFDDLLTGDNDEEPPLHPDPEPESAENAAPEAIFIEPMPVAAGEPVPTDTGSISVIDQAYEEELPDDVDETDRVSPVMGAVSVDTAGVAVVTGAIIHPPSGPISTVRVPEHEVVLSDGEPARMRVFSLEENGLEPTPIDQRVGRSARLFWLWFASNSSILSLGLGATVFAAGMSLRQSVVSVLAGVALSFIPLGLTTLAGKRSGQPTMVVSRATFGLLGNVIPAILALVTRLFWGAVLLWLLASSVAIVLVGAALDGGMGDRQLLLISLAVAFLVALLVAFAGYPLFARIQLILSVISAILVVGLIALTWKYVDVSAALTTTDGPWVLTISGTVLVFSFVGLVWANSGADLARYQRPGSSGAASMLWATIGTTLPTFILIAYGALLAASDKGIASGFLASPLDTLTLMLPNWYPVPLLAATALSLLSGVILTLYSGGFALQAIGVRVRRQWSIVIVAVLLAALALLLSFGVTGGMTELFRDAATTLAVPTAAWAGIFAAETMIRNRRFESQSLLVRGGVYPDVRWLNLIALVVISAIGFGLTTATITWLGWQGYGFTLLGMPLDSDLAASDVGVLVALVLGILVPLVGGVPAIRRQEALRPNI
jgi:purine-cytosine permease-like protein